MIWAQPEISIVCCTHNWKQKQLKRFAEFHPQTKVWWHRLTSSILFSAFYTFIISWWRTNEEWIIHRQKHFLITLHFVSKPSRKRNTPVGHQICITILIHFSFWFLLLVVEFVVFCAHSCHMPKFDEPNNHEAFFLRFDNQLAIVCCACFIITLLGSWGPEKWFLQFISSRFQVTVRRCNWPCSFYIRRADSSACMTSWRLNNDWWLSSKRFPLKTSATLSARARIENFCKSIQH